MIKVVGSDGKSGNQRELSYTNCKVVGNGSFGVVFSAKLVSGGSAQKQDETKEAGSSASAEQEEIAIKKVLQDKRFKVSITTIITRACVMPRVLAPGSVAGG